MSLGGCWTYKKDIKLTVSFIFLNLFHDSHCPLSKPTVISIAYTSCIYTKLPFKHVCMYVCKYLSLLEDMLIDSKEKGREGQSWRETLMWETDIDRLPLIHATSRDWTHIPGMCHDWKLNPWPFGLQNNAPNNWATPARAELPFKNSFTETSFTYHFIHPLKGQFIVLCIHHHSQFLEHSHYPQRNIIPLNCHLLRSPHLPY